MANKPLARTSGARRARNLPSSQHEEYAEIRKEMYSECNTRYFFDAPRKRRREAKGTRGRTPTSNGGDPARKTMESGKRAFGGSMLAKRVQY